MQPYIQIYPAIYTKQAGIFSPTAYQFVSYYLTGLLEVYFDRFLKWLKNPNIHRNFRWCEKKSPNNKSHKRKILISVELNNFP